MLISKVLIVVIVLSICEAHIVINIEPEQMQRIAQILVDDYITHNVPPSRNTLGQSIGRFFDLKKIAVGVAQLIGVTISLVSANIISAKFEPTIISPTPTVINKITHHGNNTSFRPSEICVEDFGCDRNICWRSCDKGLNNHDNSPKWCYTTSKPGSHKYQQCIYAHDCSPCWECLGTCHSLKRV